MGALRPPVAPMLARAQGQIPRGDGWRYEPKWDGFRAIVFRDRDQVTIASRNGQPLERYFPELLQPLRSALPPVAAVDGEIVIAGPHGLDFDALQSRIHPAATRVAMLAATTPATLLAFDLLSVGEEDLTGDPLDARRARCEGALTFGAQVALTPQTRDPETAASWFTLYEGAGCDGVVAKRADQPYRPGERLWVKVKHLRSVDCVVGGYRLAAAGAGIASLLLGLYDADGVLHHVGHTSSFNARERAEILALLSPLEGGTSFGQGRTPGAPSRWTGGRDASWVSVTPTLVCEVSFDHLQGGRLRHAARFLRWRTDKDPQDCTYDQISGPDAFSLEGILHPRSA